MTTDPPRLRLRRSRDRGFEDFGWTDNWMTFSFGGYYDPAWMQFGPLRVMVENHIQPHAGFPPHPHRNIEILTYVVSGTLTHRDSFGHQADITAGEMQLISADHGGMIHAEENRHDILEHNYQMWLLPDRAAPAFAYHQRGFAAADRQGPLQLYVSPDGYQGSMPTYADAWVYAGQLAGGEDHAQAIAPHRGVWVQVVAGKVTVADLTLTTGDGLGITHAAHLTLQAHEPSEILLFDVAMGAAVT
jgi:redox-sensitive bicupin YhaK (pirin superfamily)